ncbi:MAG: SUF system Fe-S cluster assembly protein [Pseudomonadota bacterium]
MSEPTPGPAGASQGAAGLEKQVIEVLRTVHDPEIPINIYELGLIYSIEVDAGRKVRIAMTLTTPHCPVAGSMPGEIEHKVRALPGVAEVKVDLVWEPRWDKSMMSEAARLELGFM